MSSLSAAVTILRTPKRYLCPLWTIVGNSRLIVFVVLRGIETDEKILAGNGCPALVAVTASKVASDGVFDVTETSPKVFGDQINEDVKGALFSAELVALTSSFIQSCKEVQVVVDAEAVFKTGSPVPAEMTRTIREKILPKTTVLSATVPEAKLLLDNAGVIVEYPKNMQDVKEMARSLQSLGPQSVILKREIFNKELMRTTLFYVLCPRDAPLVDETLLFDNPKGVTGVSYALPSAITANLASGQDVAEAVSRAYSFVGKGLKSGKVLFA